jgi:hypothetical protein
MIVFSHIPKTAGTSLKFILRNNFGRQHIDSIKTHRSPYMLDDLQFAKKVFGNPLAITGHNLVDPVGNLPGIDAKFITILRDPVTRCASHYQYDVVHLGITATFEEWINRKENQNLSVRIISGSEDVSRAKYLLQEKFSFAGITEHFENSLKLLKIQLGEPLNLEYARLITAKDNRIKNELLEDNSSLNLLKHHNALDQELYDFALHEIFLPALERHRTELDRTVIPPAITNPRKTRNRMKSVHFNKYVYRQLIKLLGK